MPVRGGSILLAGALGALGCGEDATLTLGKNPASAAEGRPRFEIVRRLDELTSGDKENDNPTLTRDLLQIFWSSERNEEETDVDVWTARRTDAALPFEALEPVDAVNSEEREASPAVSLDGDELWFSAEREPNAGETDVWYCTRAGATGSWSEPMLVTELSSGEKDTARPPGFGSRVMPLGSLALGSGYNATYLAERPGRGGAFAAPVLIEELVVPDLSTVDAFLSEDGLDLYFNLTPDAGEAEGDLYFARRPSAGEPFGAPEPLEELNTPGDERDPWLAPDGRRLFFSSDRDGTLNIYEAARVE